MKRWWLSLVVLTTTRAALADPPPVATAPPIASAPPIVVAPPVTSAIPNASAPPAPPQGPVAMVRLRGDRPGAVLERLVPPPPLRSPWDLPEDPTWAPVCAAPCGVAASIGASYRVSAPGATPTSAFSLHAPSTDLDARFGSSGVRSAGIYSIVFGFLVAAAGGVSLAVALNLKDQNTSDANTAVRTASEVAMIAGGGVGLLGVGLVLGSGSSVRDERGKALGLELDGSHATIRF